MTTNTLLNVIMQNFLSKKFKQLLKKKIETVKEMQRSSLQATIEIGDNCKQM